MNFKRIVGAWLGHGTVFELEDGMYALVDHEVSTSEARFSALAGSLLRGYAENPENLPVGNCDADIAVLKALEKPDPYYGMGKERFEGTACPPRCIAKEPWPPGRSGAVKGEGQ